MKNYTQPKLEVADIFNKHGHELSGISTDCYKVIRDIKNCRTERLGKHLRQCNECDWSEISYNSCRNRHCPKCNFVKKANWVDQRVQELLPCPYFHVVFTLPAVLNPLILRNKKKLYDLLFKSSSETLSEVARTRKNLGANLGFIGVLHTWGQNLMDHPHIHYLVPGGGLDDRKSRWISSKQKYLLPVKVLSSVFQGKFLSNLEQMYRRGELKFNGQIEPLKDPFRFKSLLCEAARKNWVVFSKEPFAGPKQVISYLGQYTHRIAISNHRLIKMEDDKVHFKYKDYGDENKSKVMVLNVREFMRRFLLHVLPKGYVRIRHFGILASRCKVKNLELIRKLLRVICATVKSVPKTAAELLKQLLGIDITLCPKCQSILEPNSS